MSASKLLLGAAALVGALALGTLLLASSARPTEAAPLPPFFESAVGTATVDGIPLLVHVVVAVEEGQDGRAVAEQAIRNLGATPLGQATWGSLVDEVDGVWWESMYGENATNEIPIEYNPANQPFSAAQTEILTAAASWTNIETSRLTFVSDGLSGACPSLVDECPGAQTLDGANTIGWLNLDAGILGVTWMVSDGSGGDPQESDVALNTYYNWSTGSSPFAINLQTVALHEIGHVAGLDHSSVRRATMYASYTRADTTLHEDDIEGLSTLYPADGTPPPDPTPTPEDPWCTSHPETHPAWDRKCGA